MASKHNRIGDAMLERAYVESRVAADAKASSRPLRGASLRRPAITLALRLALFEEWALRGYAALSLEHVAARAGVSKATLYRRWPSKLAMACEALEAVAVSATKVPDTGTLRGDLLSLERSFRALLRHRLARRIVPDLQSEQARASDLNPAISRLTSARRANVGPLIDRAVARGELPAAVDRELAADLVAGPIYWRILATRGRADGPYLRRLVDALIAAMRASSD